jgi:nucleoside-diphosphate-sugar epimerase
MLLHLIHRGEDPKRIRVLDLRSPTRPDLTSGPATLVDFVSCDITVAESVHAAFAKPWPNQEIADAPLTVFHTAANIRFYERHPALLSRSEKINVLGTQNVVDGAKEAGASVLIYTSSGSVAVKSSRFLLWPWEREPENFVQHISDEKTVYPTRHEDFFSNYSASKAKAEAIIRKADHASTNGVTLRTGSIKPSNGVYGPGQSICRRTCSRN